MKTVFIYALNEPCSGSDPTAGRTRYIGKAADPYGRYEKHLDGARKEKTHKATWIRSLLKLGKTPILEILDEVPETEWAFWECEWIRLYRALGFRLTNSTNGGDGAKGLSHSEKTKAKLRAVNLGKHHSEETCIKMSASRLGMRPSKETNAKRSATLKNKVYSEEYKARIRAIHTGKNHSEETKAKLRMLGTGRVHSEEAKAMMSANRVGKFKSEETKNKMSVAKRLWWAKKKGLLP